MTYAKREQVYRRTFHEEESCLGEERPLSTGGRIPNRIHQREDLKGKRRNAKLKNLSQKKKGISKEMCEGKSREERSRTDGVSLKKKKRRRTQPLHEVLRQKNGAEKNRRKRGAYERSIR